MAEKNDSVLPPLPSSPNASQPAASQTQMPNAPDALTGPSSKDIMIGAGALVILAVVFFFIRNSFVSYLTGPGMKRSPNSAGMAGWGLFGGLFFGAALGCVALISKSFLTLPVIIVLSLLSLICFVITFVVAAKK